MKGNLGNFRRVNFDRSMEQQVKRTRNCRRERQSCIEYERSWNGVSTIPGYDRPGMHFSLPGSYWHKMCHLSAKAFHVVLELLQPT